MNKTFKESFYHYNSISLPLAVNRFKVISINNNKMIT